MSVITVTPTVEADTTPPRVLLEVADTGFPSYSSANVVRHDPDGRTVPVRTTDGNALTLTSDGSAMVGIVYDYEAPFGQPVTYSTLEDPGTVSGEVTVDASQVWIIHPGVPELSMPVTVAEFGSVSRPAARGVFYPLGRRAPVVYTDGQRKAPGGVLTVRTDTLDELARLQALTEDTGILLMNVPVGLGWGVPTAYVSVGDMDEARLMEYAAQPKRYHSLPYQVVDRPAGGTQADRTYLDLLDFASYSELLGAYDTYLSLLSGP